MNWLAAKAQRVGRINPIAHKSVIIITRFWESQWKQLHFHFGTLVNWNEIIPVMVIKIVNKSNHKLIKSIFSWAFDVSRMRESHLIFRCSYAPASGSRLFSVSYCGMPRESCGMWNIVCSIHPGRRQTQPSCIMTWITYHPFTRADVNSSQRRLSRSVAFLHSRRKVYASS